MRKFMAFHHSIEEKPRSPSCCRVPDVRFHRSTFGASVVSAQQVVPCDPCIFSPRMSSLLCKRFFAISPPNLAARSDQLLYLILDNNVNHNINTVSCTVL